MKPLHRTKSKKQKRNHKHLLRLTKMMMVVLTLILIHHKLIQNKVKITLQIQQNYYLMTFLIPLVKSQLQTIKIINLLEKIGKDHTHKVQIYQDLNTKVKQNPSKVHQVQHTLYQQKPLHSFNLQLTKNYYHQVVQLERKLLECQHQIKNNKHYV